MKGIVTIYGCWMGGVLPRKSGAETSTIAAETATPRRSTAMFCVRMTDGNTLLKQVDEESITKAFPGLLVHWSNALPFSQKCAPDPI